MTSRASAWSYGEYHLQPAAAAAAAAAAAFDQDRHQANQLSSPAPPLPSTSQPPSHYYYGPASSSSNVDSKTSRTMASSFQPRQPPSLNIAAAAAAAAAASTYDQQQQQQQQYHYHSTSQHAQQPYSAPAFGNGGGAYYGGSHTNGNGTFAQQPPPGQQQQQQQAASNGGYGANTNGMPFMLPAPQQSGTAYGGPPMSASSGTSSSSYGGSGGVHNGGGMHANHMHSAPHSTSSFQQHHPRFNGSVTAAQNDEHGAAYGYHQQQQQQHGGGGGAIPFNGHSSNGGGAFDGAGNMGHSLLAGHDLDGHSMLPLKSKRKQVKNACINCQKACKRCDEGRPCSRCVKYGLTSSCTNSARKERKRGVKRGPYKRRATTGSHPTPLSGLSSMYGTMSPTSSSTALGGGVGGDSSSSSNGSTHGGGYHSGSGGNMLSATHFHGAAARQQITGASSQYAGHQYAAAQQTHYAADGYSANGGHEFSPAARTASVAPPITSGDVAEPGSATHGLHAHPHPHASSSPLSMYGREHAAYASTMQPPTTSASSRSYVQRPELERSGNSSSSSTMASTQSLSFYTNNGARSNEAHFNGSPMQTGGHHPASAPATSSEFASSTTTPNNGGGLGLPSPPAGSAHRGVTVPSLFSPSASGAGSSTYSQSGFLGASGHHRLHSDSGTATLHHGASSSSHSPRTPMGGAGSGSSSSAGEMSFSAATLSSGSSSSHSASGKNALSGNMNGYVHHPDATTVASLAPGTAGAFLHPPSVSASGQPFPLHMPQSVRLRANGGGYHGVGNSDDSPSLRSDLAPLKLMSSPAVGGGAPAFNHNTTSPIMRYQLPSPRTGVTGDARARSYFSKLEGGDVSATAYGAA